MADLSDQYNTELSPEDTESFSKKFSTKDTYDYDMQGYHKTNPDAIIDKDAHFPDTFKKPNHPTFSDESQYHGKDGNEGGKWDLLMDYDHASFQFTPGKTNLEHHSPEELQDYFNRIEPNNLLNLPNG